MRSLRALLGLLVFVWFSFQIRVEEERVWRTARRQTAKLKCRRLARHANLRCAILRVFGRKLLPNLDTRRRNTQQPNDARARNEGASSKLDSIQSNSIRGGANCRRISRPLLSPVLQNNFQFAQQTKTAKLLLVPSLLLCFWRSSFDLLKRQKVCLFTLLFFVV